MYEFTPHLLQKVKAAVIENREHQRRFSPNLKKKLRKWLYNYYVTSARNAEIKKKKHKSKEWFPVYSEPHIPEAVIMNILSLSPYLWDTLTQTDMQIVILSDSSSTV